MARGDGTGPMGMGPMTGRGAGFCAGSGAPGFLNRVFGRGRGLGRGLGRGIRGGGRGWRNMFYATGLPFWARGAAAAPARAEEIDSLKQQAEWLQEQQDAIRMRLEELDKA